MKRIVRQASENVAALAFSGMRAKVHHEKSDDDSDGHDHEGDVRKHAIRGGMPGLAQFDERHDEDEGSQRRGSPCAVRKKTNSRMSARHEDRE